MRHLKVFIISILLVSSVFAEEENYIYNYDLDTTIIGEIVAMGNIFPNRGNTFISLIHDNYKQEAPRIEFLDNSYKVFDKILFSSANTSVRASPLVYDFDGDSFDEVVYSYIDSNKLRLVYFDPSNNPKINSIIFELPIGSNRYNVIKLAIKAQLDNDNPLELILSIGNTFNNKFAIRGLWGIDIFKKKIIWEKISAETVTNLKFIETKENKSLLLYSGGFSGPSSDFFAFSQGHYFFIPEKGKNSTYNINLVENNSLKLDTTSHDYSTNSKAFIRAVDKDNNLIWEKFLNGASITTTFDTICVNGNTRILLTAYSRRAFSETESKIEIIEPTTGKVEKRKIFSERIRGVSNFGSNIWVSFTKEKLIKLDYSLNVLDSINSESFFKPKRKVKVDNSYYLLVIEAIGVIQKYLLFDSKLNKVASLKTRGSFKNIIVNNKLFIYNSAINKTKIYSVKYVPWYRRISTEVLRTFATIILISLVIILLMWIVTLRVSSNKIKRQNIELATTHKELKTTTSKLIQAEKLAVYGTIASSIAHEINSPLGAIINSAQRIKENKGANLEQNINLIERAGKRAKSIIEKLLIGTRNNSDDAKAKLGDVIAEWSELSDKQFENLGIKIDFELNCNQDLAISSTELNQIFTNILFNARDSIMERKGENKNISIKSCNFDNSCKIIIRDTGTGFSTTKLEKPFEAFDTSKEKGKGTGLGLWVVKSIIDNIGGKINIRNYNMGAEVEIIIPLYTETKNG